MSTLNFWNQQHPLFAQYERLYAQLVPASGSAETEEGEMLRAASRLGYDFYNNGMCNNTSGAAKYLIDRFEAHNLGCKDELRELYLFSNTGGYMGANLNRSITSVVAAVVEHIIKQNGFYLATADDMFDWQDPDFYPDEDEDPGDHRDDDEDYRISELDHV